VNMAKKPRPIDAPPPPSGYAPAPKPHRPSTIPVDFAIENTRQLRDLWSAKRPGRGSLPAYRFFDELELRPWTDNLVLYGVERSDDQLVYRFKKVGKNVVEIDGGDFSGQLMHRALPPTQLWAVIGHYDAAVRTRGPVEFHDTIASPASGAVKWDKLLLPLSDEGSEVDHLLMLLYAEWVG
jgi:hypothetical protein